MVLLQPEHPKKQITLLQKWKLPNFCKSFFSGLEAYETKKKKKSTMLNLEKPSTSLNPQLLFDPRASNLASNSDARSFNPSASKTCGRAQRQRHLLVTRQPKKTPYLPSPNTFWGDTLGFFGGVENLPSSGPPDIFWFLHFFQNDKVSSKKQLSKLHLR